jgi:hypothetical protein
VVDIALAAPLTDKDAEVRATVKDLAGNATTVQLSVRWLLNAPLLVPADPTSADGGDDASAPLNGANDGGGGGDGDGGGGGCGCRVVAPSEEGACAACVAAALALAGVRRRRRSRHARSAPR